jgi:EXS family
MWINFSQYGNDDMYIYYPTVLIVVTAAIIFCPLPILYVKARSWFLTACVSSLYIQVMTLMGVVEVTVLGILPCRVSRLLPRGHVLFTCL